MIKSLQYSVQIRNPFFRNVLTRIKFSAKQNILMEKKIIQRELNIDKQMIRDKPKLETQPDFKRNYLYGFKEEDFIGFDPIIKNAFMLKHANPNQIKKFKKENALLKYQNHPLDTGSLKSQLVSACEEVLHVLVHLKDNRRDFNAFRKFQELLARRRKLLNQIRVKDPNTFISIVKEYNIKISRYRSDKEKLINIGFKKHPHMIKYQFPHNRKDDLKEKKKFRYNNKKIQFIFKCNYLEFMSNYSYFFLDKKLM